MLGLRGALAQAVRLLTYEGRLTDPDGKPTNASLPMSFRILADNTPVWSESHGSIAVTNGFFVVRLGETTPLTSALFDGAPVDSYGPIRMLEVTINGETLAPNLRITSAAWVISAQSGPQGVAGPQGLQGTAGPQGIQGYQGQIGAQGTAGPQGIQGGAGPQGIQGPQGTVGFQGNAGPQGPQGGSPPSGVQGPQGLTSLGSPGTPPTMAGVAAGRGAQPTLHATADLNRRGASGPQGIGDTKRRV